MKNDIETIAEKLRTAAISGTAIDPIQDMDGIDQIESAYKIQKANTTFHIEAGRRVCGRKIGLTSPAVQRQLGVDQPDFGVLFEDMQYSDGDEISWSKLMQPKIEAEIALVLREDLRTDLSEAQDSEAKLLEAVDHVLPALEIVGSRIANWKIGICDTIADNASSGVYVLGADKAKKENVDWRLCGMTMEKEGESISNGCGAACLGSPLKAAVWLANKMIEYEMPLLAGDVILTGALGPMAAVHPGDSFVARINGVGSVKTNIGLEAS